MKKRSLEKAAPGRPRLLVFIVAYFAETTLKWVLERIPASVFENYDCEVLVVDDASTDRTFEVGNEYRNAHPSIPLTVLRNEFNQGYGGNQKIGYAYAIHRGFDYVVLLHGDGQYAPEVMPALLEPLQKHEADAVLGSRMLSPMGALRGGMPFYKFLGNRILTAFQNLLLGSRLSEFHSGYRLYSVKALEGIPFRLNSNDFHFDTEVIIQLLNSGARITELPIPTYYGNEICRVNGTRYAWNVTMATIRNVFHRSGLLYQRRFDPVSHGNIHYDLKLGFTSSHSVALATVPAGEAVLDIGSGPLSMAREFLKKGCSVAVVDQHAPEEEVTGITVFVQDLDAPLDFKVAPFRYLILLDIIEHLKDPELFFERLRAQFTQETKTIVISTPNVAFFVQRLMLLFGQFNYGKLGILDRTHSRLFTFRSVRHLLRDEGFQIKEIRGIPAPFPKALGTGWLGHGLLRINEVLIKLSKSLFSYQIFVIAESTPSVEFLLGQATRTRQDQGQPQNETNS